MIYFISDQHYEHSAAIQHSNRPFINIKQMRQSFKRNWNGIVTKNDTTYVVGDFSMSEPRQKEILKQILKTLNGRKILIAGNHEVNKFLFYAGDQGIGFDQVAYPYLEVEEFILCHDPTLSLVAPDRYFITGHVHQMWHTLRNCYNVGVDVNNFTPVSIETIRKHFSKIKEIIK